MKQWWMGIGTAVVVCVAGLANGGDLDSTAEPTEPGSAMYRLEDVYNRLDAGAPGAQSVFAEPTAGPGSTGRSLNEIMAKAPATNASPAMAGDVLAGKVFWGLHSGSWGQQAGTVPAGGNLNGAEGSLVITITDGLYSGSKTATAGDADLVTGNIRSGVNIFGVAGKTEVVDTTSGDAVAADIATGKKAWVDGVEVTGTASSSAYPAPVAKTGAGDLGGYTEVTGEDGHASMRKGVAWPNPRFTDNGDTVTDNMTGLMWAKDANLPGGTRNWNAAIDYCNGMNSGAGTYGYTDWRLPNVRELQSLIDYGLVNPSLPSGHPFTGVHQLNYYWSSSTHAGATDRGWLVSLYDGVVNWSGKTTLCRVLPVRGGQ